MKRVIITGARVRAVVLPDFGGMVSELQIDGATVLRMDYGKLGMSNVLSGGIPVLFPFVSRSRDDEAAFLGKAHTMPMHGFAKDLPFELVEQYEDSCTLRLRASEATKPFYPFDFELTIKYEIAGDDLRTTMRVHNTGAEALPFAAGFHPFFYTPERERTEFAFGLKEYWDYVHADASGAPIHGMRTDVLRLADLYDTVFWNGDPDCVLTNHAQGYRAKLCCTESFKVITICTALENASCIEPWQAVPGAANDASLCQILAPGEDRSYSYSICLERL